MPSPPLVMSRSRSLSRIESTPEVSPIAAGQDVRHAPKTRVSTSPKHSPKQSFREIRMLDSPQHRARQNPTSGPGQSVQQPPRSPSPADLAYSVPNSPLLGSRSCLPMSPGNPILVSARSLSVSPGASHSVPSSPLRSSRGSLPARCTVRQDPSPSPARVTVRQDPSSSPPSTSRCLASPPKIEQDPLSASVEDVARPPEGHAKLQELSVSLSRLKGAPLPSRTGAEQGRSSSPEAEVMFSPSNDHQYQDHGPLSFGRFIGAETEQGGLLTRQPQVQALQIEMQELLSIMEQQRRQNLQGKADLSPDDEERIKLQVRRVHEVASAVPESQIRTFCATIACQQTQLDLSLKRIWSKVNAVQQQVQDLLRTMSISLPPGCGTPKKETRQESMIPCVRETDLDAALEGVSQALDAKIAKIEEALKEWFAECCICTMKETFGTEIQRHEEEISFLKTRLRGSSHRLASMDMSLSLDTIAEIPDLDREFPEAGVATLQGLARLQEMEGINGRGGAIQQPVVHAILHNTEKSCSERCSKSDASTYPLSLEAPANGKAPGNRIDTCNNAC